MGSLTHRRVAIVGRGLIGHSIELAVIAGERADLIAALDRGDDLSPLRGADLVVLAAPIRENIHLLERIRPHLSSGTIVTDTSSTKTAIVEAATDLRFVGGHPVAGAAASGATGARADLFAHQNWILTPTPDSAPDDVAAVAAFVESLGAGVIRLSPSEHDRLFAVISHLPQLVISALMQTVGSLAGAAGLALAGPGLRDSTRLAASPAGIWRDVVATNGPEIAHALDQLIAALGTLRDDRDGTVLDRMFDEAAEWKRALDRGPI